MSALSNETVLLTVADGIADLRFNRPKLLNAIDEAMSAAFLKACRVLADDTAVRAIVLRGEGAAFMAGGDLTRFRDSPDKAGIARTIIEPLNLALLMLSGMPAPVIASVHGAAAGGGASIALAADFVIASEDARFTMAYARIGTSLDASSSWFLPRLVGARRAMELALLAEPVAADKALAMGLINRVVPRAALEGETWALAKRLAAGPTAAFGQIKRLLRDSSTRDLAGQLNAELAAFQSCARTDDFAEGLDAFFGKRAPEYHGR